MNKKTTLIITLLMVFLNSCTETIISDNSITSLNNQEQYKQIESYYFLGDIHNEYMQELALNFNPPNDITEKDNALDYIKDLILNFEPQDSTLTTQLQLEVSKPDFGWNLLSHTQLKTYVYSSDFNNQLTNMHQNSLIDNWEKSLVDELIILSQSYPSFEELDIFFTAKISEWESQGYLTNSNLGDFSGGLLALGYKSTEWWLNHPEYQSDSFYRIPPWVVSDALGFVVGCAIHAGSYAANNSGSLNGCCSDGMAVSAVSGAIMGSTGIIGKAGKWISKWHP